MISGDIVGVMDADHIPEKDVLLKVAQSFSDEKIDAMQCRTRSLNENENWLSKLASKEEAIWLRTMDCRDKLGLFVSLTGSCQFIRWGVLNELSGWREDALAEDMDLSLRILEAEGRIGYLSSVSSWQETPSTLYGVFRQRERWYTGCLENLIRYGSLMKKFSWRTLDAEVILVAPMLMALSPISTLCSILQLIVGGDGSNLVSIVSLSLTIMTLALLGVSLVAVEKPFRLSSLALVPLIYVYWLIQSIIAFWSLLRLLLGMKRVWRKTEKNGTITEESLIGDVI
jgi:cellulose synthase/poly-beta-1,6-N-acetylglucosamine synthase-like glycosyltransferase